MTQADSVHSTRRRTASKNRVKKVAEAVENTEQLNLRHGEAFRELESPMRELGCMAKITMETAMEISPGARNEIVHYAISRLCEMVCDLRAKYRADLNAGKAVA
jgi:hypothetical protein